MDQSLIETTLEAWVRGITGLPARWAGRPVKPSMSSAGYLVLSIDSIVVRGLPTLTERWDSVADKVIYTQEQSLTFTFGVQVRAQRQGVDHNARHFSSLIRDRLFLRQTTGEALDAAGIAVARILGDTPVSTEIDGRTMSVHQLDIRMNATSSVDDLPVETIRSLVDVEAEIPTGNTVWTGDIPVG